MSFQLPLALSDPTDGRAVAYLRAYFGPPMPGRNAFTGSAFDTWGTNDPNTFTSDDFVAVQFLSVTVPPRAAYRLAVSSATDFSQGLKDLGDDRDLSGVQGDWPARPLFKQLRALDGIGPTTASKLLARKRPLLCPVWDSVVSEVTDGYEHYFNPLRDALSKHEGALQLTLEGLRAEADVSPSVSVLRVFDVVAWMEGTDK